MMETLFFGLSFRKWFYLCSCSQIWKTIHCIEQLDYGDNDNVVRLKNVVNGEQGGISKSVNWQGGGSFVYLELKKYNQTFIEQIQEAQNTEALCRDLGADESQKFPKLQCGY